MYTPYTRRGGTPRSSLSRLSLIATRLSARMTSKRSESDTSWLSPADERRPDARPALEVVSLPGFGVAASADPICSAARAKLIACILHPRWQAAYRSTLGAGARSRWSGRRGQPLAAISPPGFGTARGTQHARRAPARGPIACILRPRAALIPRREHAPRAPGCFTGRSSLLESHMSGVEMVEEETNDATIAPFALASTAC